MGLDHGLYVLDRAAGAPEEWQARYAETGEYPRRAVTWRKLYAIHRFIEEAWLHDNEQAPGICEDGLPNCLPVPINPLVLKDLHALSVRLLSSRDAAEAAALLPLYAGDDYDQWYWDDLQEAVTDLAGVLASVQADPTLTTFYWAWW